MLLIGLVNLFLIILSVPICFSVPLERLTLGILMFLGLTDKVYSISQLDDDCFRS